MTRARSILWWTATAAAFFAFYWGAQRMQQVALRAKRPEPRQLDDWESEGGAVPSVPPPRAAVPANPRLPVGF